MAGAVGEGLMLVTWSLFTMWIVFNFLDVAVSFLATQGGASEVGLLYAITGSWNTLAINKMLLALLIGGIMVYARRDDWLAVLNLGMFGFCLYNGWVLLQQIGGAP